MTATATPAPAAPAIDWDALGVTTVAQLAPGKTIADIPAKVIEVCDASLKENAIKAVAVPNGTVAKVLAREARDYCSLHEPRLTARIKQIGETEVRIKVALYVAPETPVKK